MKLVKLIFGLILVLTVANVVLWLVLPDEQSGHPIQNDSRRIDVASLEKERGQHGIMGDIDSGMLSGLSSPSLQMKENVDFFLTPALLVQECISEDVIITYPEE